MKIFLSWSGNTSRALAEVLRGWLPSVVQAIKPYYSPDDITKGARWNTEIAKELEECKIGLLCLTADNLDAPWLMFEAGALSKSLSAARVCPLLFGIEPSDVKGPLVQFQAAPFTRDEMLKTVRMMNQELGSVALSTEVLDSVFEMWWPKLDESIKAVLSKVPHASKPLLRSDRDILEEVLARVRTIPPTSSTSNISPAALEDLLSCYRQLVDTVSDGSRDPRRDLLETVERLRQPIEHIMRHARSDDEAIGRRFRHLPEANRSPTSVPDFIAAGGPIGIGTDAPGLELRPPRRKP